MKKIIMSLILIVSVLNLKSQNPTVSLGCSGGSSACFSVDQGNKNFTEQIVLE